MLAGHRGDDGGVEAAGDLFGRAEQGEHPQHAVGAQRDVGVDVEQHLPAGGGAEPVQGVRFADPAGGQAVAAQHLQAGQVGLQPGQHLGGAVGGAVVVDDDLGDRAVSGVGGAQTGLNIGHLVAGRDQHADTAGGGQSGARQRATAGPEHRVDAHQGQ